MAKQKKEIKEKAIEVTFWVAGLAPETCAILDNFILPIPIGTFGTHCAPN